MRVNGVEAVPINWTERIVIVLRRQSFGASKWGGGGVSQMDREDFHHLDMSEMFQCE